MVRYFILSFVVTVLLCSTLYVVGDASGNEGMKKEENSLDVFDLKKIGKTVQKSTADGDAGIELCKISFPLFVALKDGAIVTLAEAEYTKTDSADDDNGNKVGVISTCFEANDNEKLELQKISDAIKEGKTQLTIDKEKGILSSTKRTFVANADGEKICIFLVSINGQNSADNWDFKLVEGAFSGVGSKIIGWKPEKSIELKDTETLKDSKKTLQNYKIKSFTTDRSAFFIKDKNIVFVVKGESTESNKKVAAVFQFEEEETGNELKLVHHESTTDSYPIFFQWNDKIFKISAGDLTQRKKKYCKRVSC